MGTPRPTQFAIGVVIALVLLAEAAFWALEAARPYVFFFTDTDTVAGSNPIVALACVVLSAVLLAIATLAAKRGWSAPVFGLIQLVIVIAAIASTATLAPQIILAAILASAGMLWLRLDQRAWTTAQ